MIFYVGIPIAVGLLLSIIINGITFGVFGILIYFPTAVGAFVAPFLFLASVQAYIRDGLLRDAFQLNLVVKISKAMGVNLILPVVSFWGILLLALPLYGFSFFLGTWILLAYSSALNFPLITKNKFIHLSVIMPTYDYKCSACGYEWELYQSMKDNPVKSCPKCKKRKAKRLLGLGAGIIF